MYIYPERGDRYYDYSTYLIITNSNPAFVETLAHFPVLGAKLTANGEIRQVSGELVTPNYFSMLGTKLILGQGFLRKESQQAHPEIVLGNDLSRKLFGNPENALGQPVTLNGHLLTVIGIAADGFKGISAPWSPTQFWISIITYADLIGRPLEESPAFPIGRLKPGMTIKQAHAITATLLVNHYPKYKRSDLALLTADRLKLPFDPKGSIVPGKLATGLLVVTGIVLLTAIANLAGIFMARSVTRTREIATRLALGAPRWRIVHQLLIESTLIAMLGGIFAFIVADILIKLFIKYTPTIFSNHHIYLDISIDFRVCIFTSILSIATGILVGLGPAKQALGTDLIRATSHGITSASNKAKLRFLIVVPQFGFSLALLLFAAGFVCVLLRSELADSGYGSKNLIVGDVKLADAFRPTRDPATTVLDQMRYASRRVLAAMESVSNLEGFGFTTRLPFLSGTQANTIIAKDRFLAGNQQGLSIDQVNVASNYFRVAEIPLLAGREFGNQDNASSLPVAIVSQSLAHALWPKDNPVGMYIGYYDRQLHSLPREWVEVIGVVGDVRPVLSAGGINPIAYFPLEQSPSPYMSFIVRTHDNVTVIDKCLRQCIRDSGTTVAVENIRMMGESIDEILYPRRMITAMLAASGLLGLLLATVGIYGAISYSVAQRTREIGIRLALGAQKKNIISLVSMEGCKVAIIGSILGVFLYIALFRIASSLIILLPAIEWNIGVVVIVFMGVIVMAACYFPSRRACTLDLIKHLREL